MLKEKLANKLSIEELEKLPSGFQKVGDIIILNLDKKLDKHKINIGEIVLSLFPNTRSICNKFGGVRGEFREPQIEILAGDENTLTTHIESGCKFRFDVRKVMFAKGNLVERTRIAKQVKKGEIIVDMFAGIGYFSVPIGVLSKPKKVYSIELNPVSFGFLKENLKINHINCVEAINGDCRKEILNLIKDKIKADRIIMGYLPPPKEFLPYAFMIAKKGSILHYEDLVVAGKEKEDVERVISDIKNAAREKDFDVKLLLSKRVKPYAPKVEHWVFDLEIV